MTLTIIRTIIVLLFVTAVAMLPTVMQCTVVGELSEEEAREITVVLNEQGLAASPWAAEVIKKQQPKTWSVIVNGGTRTRSIAWRILYEHGLPRKRDKGIGDMFPGGGLVPSTEEGKALFLNALCGEINKTLKAIPGVVEARVHFVLPDAYPLVEKREKRTASVFLKYWAASGQPNELKVKELVARAVEGLHPDNVSVYTVRLEPRSRDVTSDLISSILPTPQLVCDVFPFAAVLTLFTALLLGWAPQITQRLASRHVELA